MDSVTGGVAALIIALHVGAVFAQTSADRQLIDLERQAARAMVKHDRAVLEEFLADEYVFIDEDGNVANRTQDLDLATSRDLNLASITYGSDVKVRFYGNVGIVTGSYEQTGTYQGKDVSGTYRFTDVFAKKGDRWQCVSSHQSRVVKK